MKPSRGAACAACSRRTATSTIVAEAADGRSAVDAIVTHRPDVVFLDIRMPELDGFEVLAELSAG